MMRMFWLVLAALLAYTGVLAQQLVPQWPPAAVGAACVVLFVLMLSWQFLYRSHAAALETLWFPWLAWSGGLLFGLWATFILLALPITLAAALAGLAGAGTAWLHDALLAALAAAALIAVVGLAQALRGPVVRRIDVPLTSPHADLVGLRIAQISDLHVGPTIRRRYVERVVARVRELQPDLIAVTGDLADGHAARLHDDVAPLQGLRAPLGSYFVTGNHEYYWGAGQWLAKVQELGLVALVDGHVRLARGAATVAVGGVADTAAPQFIAAHRGEPQLARDDAPADFRLLLAHRPGVSKAAAAAGFDLQLSGHTHGGQFFPFNLVVRLAHRQHRGLTRHGAMWLYVSAGTGYWGPPHRFWIPAEITLLRLTAAE